MVKKKKQKLDPKKRILFPVDESSFDQLEDDDYVWVPEEAEKTINQFIEMEWDESVIKNAILTMINEIEDLREHIRSLQKDIRNIKKSVKI